MRVGLGTASLRLSRRTESENGRGDWIRTSDPLRPRQVRYQAALRPDCQTVYHRDMSEQGFVRGLWGVRYQVTDVSRSIAFYTEHLGFTVDQKNLPQFGQVSVGNLKLILSGPGASGSRAMPDGRQQEPGGWNRVVLHVADLPAQIEKLKQAGLHFRNAMEVGPGGKQIQLDDPDGNPIELFEPAAR